MKKTAFILGFIFLLAFLLTVPYMSVFPDTGEMEEDKTLSPYFFVKSDSGDVDQLPLLETSADVQISGVIADVTITQKYKNDGKKPIEAIYVFPASTRAAVYALTMKIDNRIIYAKIMEKKKARKAYEKAKQEGKSASLLEQHRPNVFQMNVANIMPGDVITVEMKYTELMIPEEKVYSFVYPAVVGPRYSNTSATDDSNDESYVETPYLEPGQKHNYKFDVNVTIEGGIPINSFSSKTHKMDANRIAPNKVNMSLNKDQYYTGGNRDVVIDYVLAGNKIQTGLLLNENGDENFFLLMVQPPKRVEPKDIPPREYVFVVDVSGSMHGLPLTVSKKLMVKLLKDLRPGDKFNVLLFASTSAILSEKSLPVTDSTIKEAINFIDRQDGGGGTELERALKRALDLEQTKGMSRSIVVVTDGYISFEQKTFNLIRKNLNNSNLFAFGIGSGINRHLIEGMARAGQGQPFMVLNNDEAEEIADKFRAYIESPVMTDIEIDWGGFLVYDVEPLSIPDVFANRPILVYGKYHKPASGTIKVSGYSGEQKLTVEIPVLKFGKRDTSNALKYLWARTVITTLSDIIEVDGRNDKIIEKITDLGLKYSLLTKYTSFIAVDEVVRNNEDESNTVKQPSPLPEGMEPMKKGLAGDLSAKTAGVGNKAEIGVARKAASPMYSVSNEYSEDDKYSGPTYNKEDLQKNVKYPKEALHAGYYGIVYVQAFVNEKGVVEKTTINRSNNELFNMAAVDAVKKTKFNPAQKVGDDAEGWVNVPVEFILPHEFELHLFGKKYDAHFKDGVVWADLKVGTGDGINVGDEVSAFIKLLDQDGNEIATINPAGSVKFMHGVGEVMTAIDIGVEGMKKGGKRLLVFERSELSYGGEYNMNLPHNVDRYYVEVEVLDIS